MVSHTCSPSDLASTADEGCVLFSAGKCLGPTGPRVREPLRPSRPWQACRGCAAASGPSPAPLTHQRPGKGEFPPHRLLGSPDLGNWQLPPDVLVTSGLPVWAPHPTSLQTQVKFKLAPRSSWRQTLRASERVPMTQVGCFHQCKLFCSLYFQGPGQELRPCC